MPEISIIIINFNTYNLTCNCLESIYTLTKDVEFEVILVDNASTECSPQLFKEKYPLVNLVISKENIGFSKGNNLGIKFSKGEYILLLNSDTELQNNAVKMVYDVLKNDSKIGAASSKLIFQNGIIQSCCQKFPSVFLNVFEFSRLHKLFPLSIRSHIFFGSYFDHLSYAEPDWIWGTFFMFPRQLLGLMKHGILNDDFFMYIEDMKWCYDIRKLGLKAAYVPDAITLHHMGGSSADKKRLMFKNYNLFLKKNYNYFSYILLKK
jgi:GT2 family glycosyltransferase